MLANAYVEGNQVKVTAWFLTPHTIGSCEAGSDQVTVADAAGLANGNPVVLAGAGPEGRNLVTSITGIAGNVVTIAALATTTVRWTVFGKLTDPSTTTFKVKQPDATVETFTTPHAAITLPAAGIYLLTYDHPANEPGTYEYTAAGTGAAKGAARGSFVIVDDGMP